MPNVVGILTDSANGNKQIWFICPGCKKYHMIPVSEGQRKHPDIAGQPPHPDKTWLWNGSLEKPTVHPSWNWVGHCHLTMNEGVISFCEDSSHELRGKSVAMESFTEW